MSETLPSIWPAGAKPVVGMLHAPPLPGAPRFDGRREAILDRVLRDAETLAEGGVDGLMLENFGDTPFYPRAAPPAAVAHLTWLAVEVRRQFKLPLGVNLLRNDARGALAVATAAGARFIRVNVLSGARVTDQGVIEGDAHAVLRERVALHATSIRIFADVDVKHSAPLGPPRPVEDEVADLLHRAGADALIVSGSGTGRPADVEQLCRVKAAAGGAPVFVGSGVTAESVAALGAHADGFIVGTALKVDGLAENPVDAARVRALLAAVRALRP